MLIIDSKDCNGITRFSSLLTFSMIGIVFSSDEIRIPTGYSNFDSGDTFTSRIDGNTPS